MHKVKIQKVQIQQTRLLYVEVEKKRQKTPINQLSIQNKRKRSQLFLYFVFYILYSKDVDYCRKFVSDFTHLTRVWDELSSHADNLALFWKIMDQRYVAHYLISRPPHISTQGA